MLPSSPSSTLVAPAVIPSRSRDTVATLALAKNWSALVPRSLEGVVALRDLENRYPTEQEWVSAFAPWISDINQLPPHEVLKAASDGDVLAAHLSLGDRTVPVVIKRRRAMGLRRKLADLCRGSREHRDFLTALSLLRAGIDTAYPIACLTRRRPTREVWLVTERLPHAVDLDQVCLTLLPRLSGAQARPVKKAITSVVVDQIVCLERGGFEHRDFKASNLMLTNWSGGGGAVRAWLVDIEGVRRIPRLRPGFGGTNPIVRLAASLAGYSAVTHADRARFLILYLERRSDSYPRSQWKLWYRSTAASVAAYNRRALRRKKHKLDGYAG